MGVPQLLNQSKLKREPLYPQRVPHRLSEEDFLRDTNVNWPTRRGETPESEHRQFYAVRDGKLVKVA